MSEVPEPGVYQGLGQVQGALWGHEITQQRKTFREECPRTDTLGVIASKPSRFFAHGTMIQVIQHPFRLT